MEQSTLARFYRSLYRIRRVEEEIVRFYPTDKVKSPVHLSIGQEAVSVGVCEALRQDDVVFGTYRGHALYLAKGGDMKKMVAELYGKVTGCAKGKAGSMHLVDTASGVMGTSAIVATTIPQSVGYGYALKLQGKDSLVASFFGDGAVDEGVFYESMNFAGLKQVPVIFICENNLYAIHSHYLTRQAKDNICERVRTFAIPAERIEDNDVVRIYDRVKEAADEIRSGNSGPRFFECMTYRWKEHVGPGEDWNLGYRPEGEAKQWIEKDQLERLAALIDAEARRHIEAEVETEIREAVEFAERSPFPGTEELYTDLFREC
jgi:TPP-dependent pyruvate/acetoin dehydrogenase alpha subunit